MLTDDEQPVTPVVEEPATPAPAPKARKARKPAAKAAADNGKAPKAAKAKKAAPKAAKKAAKPGKKAAKVAKARQRDPAKLDQFGYRKGSVRSKAAQIYAGKKGATLAEVKEKVGSVQYNVLNELKKRGHKLRQSEEKNRSGRTITRYFVTAA